MSTATVHSLPGLGPVVQWSPADLARIAGQRAAHLPVLAASDVCQMLPGLDLWDMWQLQRPDGSMALIDGREYWFFLAAAQLPDPNDRHDHARIRLLSRAPGGRDWKDCGNALPDGLNPGTREWSGTAVLEADDRTLSLYFTAAGRREGGPRFEQRLFFAQGQFRPQGDAPLLADWTAPAELFVADGRCYQPAAEPMPIDGMIRGFRDPAFFRDPADGQEYILFTGSAAASDAQFDGLLGIARRKGLTWVPLAPLVDAIGVNKELERPHIVVHGGRYYLFWSTQAQRFAPGIAAPTGLYGMVADSLSGPWAALNGSTLVVANPAGEPAQAYCWWVTADLEVLSFIDQWGLDGRSLAEHPDLRRSHFGGTVAPSFRLVLDGDRVSVA